MLKIEKVNDQKIYCIKNKYLCECGLLNEKMYEIHEKKKTLEV